MARQRLPQAGHLQQDGQAHDERACIEAVRRGSEEALETLFRTYYGELLAFVEAQVRDRPTAEEVVDEIFLDIWQHGSSWTLDGPLRPYLYGAARKKCLMHFRGRRRRYRVEGEPGEPAGGEGPGTDLRLQELNRAVEEAVDALPERRRLIFMLSRNQGLSYAEIAAVLDLSTNTVRNQMSRALHSLRMRLAPYLSVLIAVLCP